MTTEAAKPAAIRRLPVGLTIATAIALAILLGLGLWQVKRLAWKEDLLRRVAALQAAPPAPLGPMLDRIAKGADVDYSRVEVDCPGLGSAPFLQIYSVRSEQAGQRLVSACQVTRGGYGSILVDRGYLPDTVTARPPVDPQGLAPVHMVGVLRSPDRPSFVTPKNDIAGNRWYWRDLPAMARALKVARPAPVMLMAETSSNPELKALNRAPLPADIPNRHLEYAMTWFGLAAALAGVYAASLWKRWKS